MLQWCTRMLMLECIRKYELCFEIRQSMIFMYKLSAHIWLNMVYLCNYN
jgi:hypothetical protein